MLFSNKQSHYFFSIATLGASIASLIVCAILYFNYHRHSQQFWHEAKENALKQTKEAAQTLDTFMGILEPVATQLAEAISRSSFTPQEIEGILKRSKIDDVSGVGVAFLPNVVRSNNPLFARSIIEKDGKIVPETIEDKYDYLKKNWFVNSIQNGKTYQEANRPEQSDGPLAEFTAPIYQTKPDGSQEMVGIAFANQTFSHLQNIIEALFLGHNGYWFILTSKGTFLAYPQLKYRSGTIFDIAQDINNPALADEAKKIIKGESVFFTYNNEITNAASWMISSPIIDTNWSIVGVFDQGEFTKDSNVFRRKLISPSIAFLLALIFFTLFIGCYFKKNTYLWIFLSIFISIGIFLQIIWMWYAIYHYPYKRDEPNVYLVESKQKLFEYLKENFPPEDQEVLPEHQEYTLKERLLRGIPYKQYIPTGVYINSLQFSEASEIKLSAYFWQRLTMGMHDKIPPGFVFIQTNDANIIEETAVMQNNDKLVTYDVFAKLNQYLTYSLYPFDNKSLRIKYWSKTSDETFYFIPDLSAYQLINPKSLPGVDPDVYIPGWELIGSYFGYQKLPYTNNFGAYLIGPFGVYEEDDLSVEPQPFFEIQVRRNLSDALISDLIPIAVIAVLLFLVLLISKPESDKYLTAIASIFFATIFAQIRFRSKIPQAQIVYLESLYFILYIIMLCLLVICYLIQNKIKIRHISGDQNLLIKAAYWPFLLGTFSMVSLFYLW